MRTRLTLCVAVVSSAVGLAMPIAAGATPVTATLTSSTGEGTFDNTIGCPNGDGPSWRYEYTGDATAGTGPLGGIWSGTTEIHDAGGGQAFAQQGGGRLRITTPDRGSVDLEMGGGDCTHHGLTLGSDGNGDPTVSGGVPLTAAGAGGGTGALRNVTGTGTATLAPIGVGPGADNSAKINVSANLTALAPGLTVGDPTAQYIGILDWLSGTATVSIPITNQGPPATVGDAFDVKVTSASVSPQGTLISNALLIVTIGVAGPVTGPPVSLGRIDNGSTATAVVKIAHTFLGATYTLTTTAQGNDALNGLTPAVTQSRTFTTPILPSLMLLPLAPII